VSPQLLVVSEESAWLGIVRRHAGVHVEISAVEYADLRRTCADKAPDAMLFDVPADRAEGDKALELLQATCADLPAIPVLVLTWQRLPQRLAEGVFVLEKPFAFAALREAIDTLMRTAP